MAQYVSDHPSLPSALTLEFERVLSPLLLDAHNRYAGAEFTSGNEARGALHQKGLVERRQCAYVSRVVKGALERLLVLRDRRGALEYCGRMCSALLGGEVPSSSLVEGGFLKRADQRDLLRMASLGREADKKADRATREADETLRKENAVSLAIEMLKRSATADRMPTIVFRQGEYVPFVAVRRSGGAAATKQFENVAPPDEVIQLATPVDLRLLFERRLLPALIGQVKEASGKATKEAAEADRPALIGRLLTSKERQELRYGAHSRKAYGGVLTCDEGWRLYGLSAAPPEPMSQAKGGQSKIATFFGAGAAKAKEAKELQMVKEPQEAEETRPPEVQEAQEEDAAEAGAAGRPATPGTDAKHSAASADDDVAKWEAEVARLTRLRRAISVRSGHAAGGAEDGEPPLLLHNHASALANAMRLLDAARRKRARRNGLTPPQKL